MPNSTNDRMDLTTMGATAPIVPELVEPYQFTAETFPNLTMTPEQLSLEFYIVSGELAELKRRFKELEDFVYGE